jgi:hypothetical protein
MEYIQETSEAAKTNQIKIFDSKQDILEKFDIFLHQNNIGIAYFKTTAIDDLQKITLEYKKNINDLTVEQKANYYREKNDIIKKNILQRDKYIPKKNIHYSIIKENGNEYIFYFASKYVNAKWKQKILDSKCSIEPLINAFFRIYIFKNKILNKCHVDNTLNTNNLILALGSEFDKKINLVLHGYNVDLNYNKYGNVFLNLRYCIFEYKALENNPSYYDEEIGDFYLLNQSIYQYSRKKDARNQNKRPPFIRFYGSKKNEGAKWTKIHYFNIILEKFIEFLNILDIDFEKITFQTKGYLKDCFINNLDDKTSTLVIVNNLDTTLLQEQKNSLEKLFLEHNFIKIKFYNDGKNINEYEKIKIKRKENDYEIIQWQIKRNAEWNKCVEYILHNNKYSYLFLNKKLNNSKKENISMAYIDKNTGCFYSNKFTHKNIHRHEDESVDFYTFIKRKILKNQSKFFYKIQGYTINDCNIVDNKNAFLLCSNKCKKIYNKNISIKKEIDFENLFDYFNILLSTPSTDVKIKDSQIYSDTHPFINEFEIKINNEVRNIITELHIKNIIHNLINQKQSVKIQNSFDNSICFNIIYTKSPKDKTKQRKAVDVTFLLHKNNLSITEVNDNISEIARKYPFLKREFKDTSYNEKEVILYNEKNYIIDSVNRNYISFYHSPNFTPVLLGSPNFMDLLDADIESNYQNHYLEFNSRKKNSVNLCFLKRYNKENIKLRMDKIIPVDLTNKNYIQYFIYTEHKNLNPTINNSPHVFHLTGKNYEHDKTIENPDLFNLPITRIFFSTLTQSIVKLGRNSTSSLLQKICKTLVEN